MLEYYESKRRIWWKLKDLSKLTGVNKIALRKIIYELEYRGDIVIDDSGSITRYRLSESAISRIKNQDEYVD